MFLDYSCIYEKIAESTLIALTLIAHIRIVNTRTTTTTRFGFAKQALVMVVDAVTPSVARLCITGTAKISVVDGLAITPTFLGFAVSALVCVVDGVTRATAGFCFAGTAKIGVVDSGAGTTVSPRLTESALIIIIDGGTTGVGVTAKHQQHCNNDFHCTLP